MATENIIRFHEAVEADPALRAKIQAISAGDALAVAERLAALSEEAGLPFTAEEYRAARPGFAANAELNEEELSGVVGGTGRNIMDLFATALPGLDPIRKP